ncbi:hypothetical protein [Luteimonas sp. FCS-9]|uniref:hypothetical protein n=1 Tax=Luteimonas sp. FCS-9 TaxID=1547516 RepID=UPI0012E02701|nr:hypothetical protein [Luteimonas sp. FCS-9]
MSLTTFCSLCEEVGRFESEDDFLKVVPALQKLILNQDLLEDHFKSLELNGAPGVSQSIMLAAREHFYVRAMIWPAIPASEMSAANLFKYAYCVPHDHNFSFLTIGYFGPGYRTKFFRSGRGAREVAISDKVLIEESEEIVLERGDCAIVYEYDDVHVQYPPSSLSISINLVPRSKFKFKQAFMTHQGEVVTALDASSQRDFLKEMANFIGSDRLVQSVDAYYD